MLASASRVAAERDLALLCVHVVHGIRPEEEGRADSEHVRSLCELLNVPCRVVSVPRGGIAERARFSGRGVEDAARHFRHRILRESARRFGAVRILIGHTDDDLLESLLMRFLRGAGPAGLSALSADNGLVLRPLLSHTRADVLSYLKDLGLAFREDSTNADRRYMRNRVRSVLVPSLDAEFPGWRTAVRSLGRTQSELARFLERESDLRVRWHADGESALETDADPFFRLALPLRVQALYSAVNRLDRLRRSREESLAADPPSRKERDPARTVLESFATGKVSAQSLGPYRLAKSARSVRVESAVDHGREAGFCTVAVEPGRYVSGPVEFSIGPRIGDRSIPVRLPAVARSPRACERAVLRAAFKLPRASSAIRLVVEDARGFVGVFVETRNGLGDLLRPAAEPAVSGYAEPEFFSIL